MPDQDAPSDGIPIARTGKNSDGAQTFTELLRPEHRDNPPYRAVEVVDGFHSKRELALADSRDQLVVDLAKARRELANARSAQDAPSEGSGGVERPWRIERFSPYAAWVPTGRSFSTEERARIVLASLLPSRPELSPRTFGANPRLRVRNRGAIDA